MSFPVESLAKKKSVKGKRKARISSSSRRDPPELDCAKILEEAARKYELESQQDPSDPSLPDRSNDDTKSTRFYFIGKTEILSSMLKGMGFSAAEICRIKQSPLLAEDFPLVQNGPVLITQYERGQGQDVKVFDLDNDLAFLFWKQGSRAGVKVVPSQLETKVRTIEGQVGRSLAGSLQSATGDGRVVQRFLNAFILDYDVEHLSQKGSRFALRVEEQYYNGRFIKFGEVLQAALEINGKVEERKYIKFLRGGAFVPPDVLQEDKPMFSPVSYIRVTSPFNPKRFHPFRRRRLPHNGVDLGLAKGENVFAAQEGVVIKTGRSRGGGNFIMISHDSGYETSYEHLSSIESDIVPGVTVEAGQKIAEVGCTGYCTSPHLHFSVKKDGDFLNPFYYMKSFPRVQLELIQAYMEDQSKEQISVPAIAAESEGESSREPASQPKPAIAADE